MNSVVKKPGFMWEKSNQVTNPSKSNNPAMPRPCPNSSSPKPNRLSIRGRRHSKHRAFCSNPEKSASTHRLSIKSAPCASAAGIVSYQFSSLSNRTSHTRQAEYGNGGANSLGRYEYIWLPTDSGDAIPIGLYKSGKFFAVHSDHLGTPRIITDETNTPIWQWPYSAFGESSPTGVLTLTNNSNLIYTQDPTSLNRLKLTTPGVVYNLRHAGQYADSESGLFYNYFRSYDPKTGRYSQNDPIGLGGGLNRFGYANQNGLMFTDPRGLAPGDLYPSEQAAATSALNDIYPESVRRNIEFAGMIYKKPDGQYSYSPPRAGSADASDPGGQSVCPRDTLATATYHSHGAKDDRYGNQEDFSIADMLYSRRNSWGAYLVTPSGVIRFYDQAVGARSTLGRVRRR